MRKIEVGGHYFKKIELTWARWGLVKSLERDEFTNCGKNEKLVQGEQYEFLKHMTLWKKFKWVHGEQYELLNIN